MGWLYFGYSEQTYIIWHWRLAFTAVDMTAVGPEETILNQADNIPDDLDADNQDEETAAMIEEPASGMVNFPNVFGSKFFFL